MKTSPPDYYGKPPVSGTTIKPTPADVATTQSIVDAMYESISGPAGQPRQWDRFRSLNIAEAYSIRTGKLEDGSVACKIMSSEQYIEQMDAWLLENGFYETEIHRVEERFGNICHVFSTYESRHKADDPKPYIRGINSIQLLYDGSRWWVMNVMWQHETAEFHLPAKYVNG